MQSFYATRRGFLRGTAIGALGLALDLKTLRPVFADARLPPEAREYTGYRDVYRRKWSWDRIGVGTHSCTNCASGGCSWNLYVRDGIVWREEQGAPYTQTNASVPDYNPRGCQKGASASALYRSPARIRYPLKRVGARGENRWKRISLGRGPRRDRGATGRHAVDTRRRRRLLRERQQQRLRPELDRDGAFLQPARHADHRELREHRRPDDRRHAGAGQPGSGRLLGRLVPLRLLRELVRQPDVDPHPRRALHHRDALPGRQVRLGHAGLQSERDPHRSVDRGTPGHRRRARAGGLQDHHRRGSARCALHHRADRPAAADPRGHAAVPARIRRGRGRPHASASRGGTAASARSCGRPARRSSNRTSAR